MNGGHEVPILKIIDRYYRSLENCSRIINNVDWMYLYDNTLNDTEPRLIFRIAEGKIVKKYEALMEWTKVIYKNAT